MASPSAYADQYLSLRVPSPIDGSTDLATSVSVGNYLMGIKSEHARSQLLRKVEHDFKAGKKQDPSYTLRVRVWSKGHYQTKEFSEFKYTLDDPLYSVLRLPFGGKGTPEGIQAVLQLAATVGPSGEPALVTPGNFQKYCDDNLGTDCNGFVGNFLRHEVGGADWATVEARSEIGPQELIDVLMKKASGRDRADASSVNFQDFNLLAEVNGHGQIIPGGAAHPGHTGISEPGLKHRLMFARGAWLDCPTCPDGTGVPGIWVTESTSEKGLSKSWYHLFDHPKSRTDPRWKGVLSIHRGVKNEFLDFRIKSLTVP